MARPDIKELRTDVLDELSYAAKQSLAVHDRLLQFCENWEEDRVLGPALDLGLQEGHDGFKPLRDRVVAAGGPSRHLEAAARANRAVDRLVARPGAE